MQVDWDTLALPPGAGRPADLPGSVPDALRPVLQKLELLRLLQEHPLPGMSEDQHDVVRAAFALCSKVRRCHLSCDPSALSSRFCLRCWPPARDRVALSSRVQHRSVG